MDNFSLVDNQGKELNDFVSQYRDSLKEQYDSSLMNLQQQRKNQMASIMSGANAQGMMYSNFPQRSKMQYEAQTYTPAVAQAHQTYQTGLDTLRGNAVNAYNNLKSMQDAISDLNSSGSGGGGSGTTGGTTGGTGGNTDTRFDAKGNPTTGYYKGAEVGKTGDPYGIYFYLNGKPVTASTYAKSQNIPLESLLKTMQSSASSAYDRNAAAYLAGTANEWQKKALGIK